MVAVAGMEAVEEDMVVVEEDMAAAVGVAADMVQVAGRAFFGEVRFIFRKFQRISASLSAS